MQKLLEIIAEHNDPKRDLGYKRQTYAAKLWSLKASPEIVSVVGIRRCGKSTLLQQLQRDLLQELADPSYALFINFEDPRLEEIDTATKLLNLIKAYESQKSKADRLYFFLDEIDRVKGWEKALNFFYEQGAKIKFFISGSNSEIFSGKLATVLSGRFITLRVYPLDFKEFLVFRPNFDSPLAALKDYIEWGGFPRVALENDTYIRTQILLSYFETILEKDLIIRHKIRKTRELKDLLKYICLNPTRLFSSYNLAEILNIQDSTINRYIDYMEQAFIVKRISLYSPSVKKQIYNPDKILLADNGLARIAGFSGGDNFGMLLENAIGMALLRRSGRELYYWKKNREIDFVELFGSELNIYNVTASLDDDQTYLREISALDEGQREHASAKAHLLTVFNELKREDSRIELITNYL